MVFPHFTGKLIAGDSDIEEQPRKAFRIDC